MADIIFPIEPRDYLKSLTSQIAEIYVAGIDGQTGKVYEVISREPGLLRGYFFGDLEEVAIHGTRFEDQAKSDLWEQFHLGGLPWDELVSRGGTEGFDPTPKGDYLLKVEGYGDDDRLVAFGQKYDLASNVASGDRYKMFLFLQRAPTKKVLTVINPNS